MTPDFQRRRGECVTILLLVFVVIILVGSIQSCTNEKERAKEAARQEALASDKRSHENGINDEKALLPMWYRVRFKPWSEGMAGFDKMNELLMTIYVLGLVLYPAWIVLFDRFSQAKPSEGEELGGLVVGLTLAAYAVNLAASGLLYAFIYLIISPFNTQNYYVPYGFISFSLHGLTHLTCAAMLTMIYLGSQPGASAANNTKAVPQKTTPYMGPHPLHYALRAMGRALLVAIGTSCGSQIGGWIGGLIVFVLASGLATVWGRPIPTDHSHHHPSA